jgi:hypothetical protein
MVCSFVPATHGGAVPAERREDAEDVHVGGVIAAETTLPENGGVFMSLKTAVPLSVSAYRASSTRLPRTIAIFAVLSSVACSCKESLIAGSDRVVPIIKCNRAILVFSGKARKSAIQVFDKIRERCS